MILHTNRHFFPKYCIITVRTFGRKKSKWTRFKSYFHSVGKILALSRMSGPVLSACHVPVWPGEIYVPLFIWTPDCRFKEDFVFEQMCVYYTGDYIEYTLIGHFIKYTLLRPGCIPFCLQNCLNFSWLAQRCKKDCVALCGL